MVRLEPASSSVSKKGCAWRSGNDESSWMLRPATRTWRASSLNRVPPHSGQTRWFRYFASSSFTATESVSR